jgi:hypothetical protein
VDKENIGYKRMKNLLITRKGFKETDFDKDGILYGLSTNQLLDIARMGRLKQ